MRVQRLYVLPFTLSLALAVAPAAAAGSTLAPVLQTPEEGPVEGAESAVPPDTYRDAEARVLVEKARAAWEGRSKAIDSYEARIHERGYIGVRGERLSRDRVVYERERTGKVRWQADGSRMVRWDGGQEVVFGMRSDEHPQWEEDLVDWLAGAFSRRADFLYDPEADGIGFGVAGFGTVVHPLAAEAGEHYRYATGDTLRLVMPDIDREITLTEVMVEPRRTAPDLAYASLWVDVESGHVVRVLYRAARPWNLGLDGDRTLMGLAKLFEAHVEAVAVDYGFHEMAWWLPRRHALQLTLRAGSLLKLPVTMEWMAEDYRLNDPASGEWDPETFPEDWVVREGTRGAPGGGSDEEAPDSIRWLTATPPAGVLLSNPDIGAADGRMGEAEGVGVFEPEELEGVPTAMEGSAPQVAVPEPDWSWGLEDQLLRYNRVEGLSAGLRGELPLTLLSPSWAVGGEIRLGAADLEPRGEVAVWRDRRRGRATLAAYRRLDETSDWERHTSLSSSVASLVWGSDRGDYYHAEGVELKARQSLRRLKLRGRLFGERHRPVEGNTDFHLTGLLDGDSLRSNPPALGGAWLGGEVAGGIHRGTDPRGTRLSGEFHAEAAQGEPGAYLRVTGALAAAHRWDPLDLGVKVGAGRSWGALPVQREFALVGPATLRGPASGSVRGPAHWFARAESSYQLVDDVPGVRAVAFLDAGWAGDTGSFTMRSTELHPGLGLSIADGTVRLDVTNPTLDDRTTRFYVYFDGVL